MRSKDLLVEFKCSKKNRGRLESAFKEVIGNSGSVWHLIPRIAVEFPDIYPSTDAEDVEEAVSGFFDHVLKLELEVSLTKRPFRGNRKAYVLLEETWALKLLKAINIKIRWVFCRVRRKTVVDRWYRCSGFSHMPADLRGPDWSQWKCSKEGHSAGSCST